MRRVSTLLAVIALAAACSSPPPRFSLSDGHVDATYWCPGGSTDAKYDVHATVQARNPTSKDVTVDSATADMVLVSITGSWLEKVGDRYDASGVTVSPSTVAANSNATLEVTIPSSCTSGHYGSSLSSSGSYRVAITVVTSAGTFTVASANLHEIRAA